jgi:hypothetical protein
MDCFYSKWKESYICVFRMSEVQNETAFEGNLRETEG